MSGLDSPEDFETDDSETGTEEDFTPNPHFFKKGGPGRPKGAKTSPEKLATTEGLLKPNPKDTRLEAGARAELREIKRRLDKKEKELQETESGMKLREEIMREMGAIDIELKDFENDDAIDRMLAANRRLAVSKIVSVMRAGGDSKMSIDAAQLLIRLDNERQKEKATRADAETQCILVPDFT